MGMTFFEMQWHDLNIIIKKKMLRFLYTNDANTNTLSVHAKQACIYYFFLLFHDILNKLYKRVTRIAIWNNCFSSCFQCCCESKSIYCPLNVSADLNNERLSYELCCIYYSNIFTRYSFLLTWYQNSLQWSILDWANRVCKHGIPNYLEFKPMGLFLNVFCFICEWYQAAVLLMCFLSIWSWVLYKM